MCRSKSYRYSEYINLAYEVSVRQGLKEGSKHIKRYRFDTQTTNVMLSVLVKRYTKVASAAISSLEEFTGISRYDAKELAVIGAILANTEGDVLNSLIILMANSLKAYKYATASKILRAVKQGPMSTLTPDAMARINFNEKSDRILDRIYPGQEMVCGLCKIHKPVSEFICGSSYCSSCRDSGKGEPKQRNRTAHMKLQKAIEAAESVKRVKIETNKILVDNVG